MKRLLVAFLLVFALPAKSAVIFMYHRFGEAEFPSTSVTLAQFEAQLDFLEREGFDVWPLPKLVTSLQQGKAVPDGVVVITIDDAYASVHEHAYPMLRSRGMPFTVFVATDPIDLGLSGYMTWAQLRELHEAGATLANHGASHGYLVQRKENETEQEWQQRVRADIAKGQSRLQEEIDTRVNASPQLFAYPFGEYDVAMMQMLEAMGYVAFGQHSGAAGVHDDLRALPRFPVNERYGKLPDFALKARTLPFAVEEAAPVDPLVGDGEAPVLTLAFGESAADLDRLACYFGSEALEIRWTNRAERRAEVRTDSALPQGRSRYNCTAPHRTAPRWYWYSHPWINPGRK